MINLKYAGEKNIYEVEFEKLNRHVVQITREFPVKTKGFVIFRDGKEDDAWDYTGFKTLYLRTEGGAQFSDDGSVYTAPVPTVAFTVGQGGTIDGEILQSVSRYEDLVIPSPVADENYEFAGWEPEIPDAGVVDGDTAFEAKFTYAEPLEEVKARKISEMDAAQQAAMQGGINVALTDGSVEHFALAEYEQKRLMALQASVAAGDEKIPWHTSNLDDPCRYFSNADMQLIIKNAMGYGTYHETYYRDLRRYINSLEDKASVEAVTYGMVIPEEYRSEVLVDMYAAQEAQQEV